MLDYIKQTLKIDFKSCRIKKDGWTRYYEFILTDETILRISEHDILFKINNRHSKIQLDSVSIGKYLLEKQLT
jgi:type VI protein secretion system component Hcp